MRASVGPVPQQPHQQGHSRVAGFHNASQAVTCEIFADSLQCMCQVSAIARPCTQSVWLVTTANA